MLNVARELLANGRVRNADLIAVLNVDAAVARECAVQEERDLTTR